MSVIDDAVSWAIDIANDNTHGYDQTNRMGPDYDCSSFVSHAYAQAGAGVYAGDTTFSMKSDYLAHKFKDVTNQINLANGAGTKKGDVLLNESNHTALVIANGGRLAQASINENGETTGGKTGDQTGTQIWIRSYYNYPWDCVLRYDAEVSFDQWIPG